MNTQKQQIFSLPDVPKDVQQQNFEMVAVTDTPVFTASYRIARSTNPAATLNTEAEGLGIDVADPADRRLNRLKFCASYLIRYGVDGKQNNPLP